MTSTERSRKRRAAVYHDNAAHKAVKVKDRERKAVTCMKNAGNRLENPTKLRKYRRVERDKKILQRYQKKQREKENVRFSTP